MKWVLIGPGHGLIDIVEARDGNHGTEHLFAHDLVVLPCAGDDGRLEKEALAAGRFAAGGDRNVFLRARPLDEALHAGFLRL
jgi:hypothetical protein